MSLYKNLMQGKMAKTMKFNFLIFATQFNMIKPSFQTSATLPHISSILNPINPH